MFNRKLKKEIEIIHDRMELLYNEIFNIRITVNGNQELIRNLNLPLNMSRICDLADTNERNMKRLNEMACELKGVISMARAAIAERKEEDKIKFSRIG